mmetsp:Transcript_8168/g.23083  ORF Transcript_8168/g.23083 Transcript_8168/m.23083 type:complete len:284 (+) Transcript_8168:251-1102(+)
MMCSEKSCSTGPCTTPPTKRLNLMRSLLQCSGVLITLNLTAPLRGPSCSRASCRLFCSRAGRLLNSTPCFGSTMRRSSGSPPAAKVGETQGLPTHSFSLPLTFSMRHSTRSTDTPSTSLLVTVRLSGTGVCVWRPGGNTKFSVFDLDSTGWGDCGVCSSRDSGTAASAGAGTVFALIGLRARPTASSEAAAWVVSAKVGCRGCGGSALRRAALGSTPARRAMSFISATMSAMSFEIWPLVLSSFWTRWLKSCALPCRLGAMSMASLTICWQWLMGAPKACGMP